MVIGYLIDGICNLVLKGIAIIAVAFVVSCIVILIGEKTKWW